MHQCIIKYINTCQFKIQQNPKQSNTWGNNIKHQFWRWGSRWQSNLTLLQFGTWLSALLILHFIKAARSYNPLIKNLVGGTVWKVDKKCQRNSKMGRTPQFQTEKSAAVLKTSSFPQTSSKKEGSQKNISMATKPFSIRAVNAVFANVIKI